MSDLAISRATGGVQAQRNIYEQKPNEKLDPRTQQEVDDLKRRDAQVRQHEAAHLGAAGQFANGGANYQYAIGPDGKRYAVGGEVSIDTSDIPGNPQANLQKARTIRRAALAPMNPSGQDRMVAAQAARMEAEAAREIALERQKELEQNSQGARPQREQAPINFLA